MLTRSVPLMTYCHSLSVVCLHAPPNPEHGPSKKSPSMTRPLHIALKVDHSIVARPEQQRSEV